jgi:hypothetical protein
VCGYGKSDQIFRRSAGVAFSSGIEKEAAGASSAFVGVGRLPSNGRASSLSPEVDWTLIVVRVWFFIFVSFVVTR